MVFTGWKLADRHSPTPVQGRTKHWVSRMGMQLCPLGHSLCPLWREQGRGPHHTFEQAILPSKHWQALQSSSHLAPSGITLPTVMQGRPETSWHFAPLCPGGQTHRYPLISSTQVAPKAQGEDWHSLMFILQSGPAKPGAHSQRYQLSPSTQVPLL